MNDSVRLLVETIKKDSEIMAASIAALRAALVCMGTTAEVANEITSTQGIDTIKSYAS